MADEYLDPADYGDFDTGYNVSLKGARAWWNGLRNVPADDLERIRQVIRDDAQAYERLEFDVTTRWNGDAELIVNFRSGYNPTSSDVALLKGMMAATLARAGWGGPG